MFFYLTIPKNQSFAYAYMDISFEKFHNQVCDSCQRKTITPVYSKNLHHLVVEGGTVMPDRLAYCGAGLLQLIISQDARNVFEQHNISGILRYEPVKISFTKRGGADSPHPLPQYYLAHIQGRIDVDFRAMCLKKKKYCSVCGKFEWNRQRLQPLILNADTWDKSDVCIVSSMPGHAVFSERVVDIIESSSLNGFDFVKYRIGNAHGDTGTVCVNPNEKLR